MGTEQIIWSRSSEQHSSAAAARSAPGRIAVPPSVRRPRATRTSTANHAFHDFPLRSVPAPVGEYAERPGSCRKPSGARHTVHGKKRVRPFFRLFAMTCDGGLLAAGRDLRKSTDGVRLTESVPSASVARAMD